MKAPRLVFPVAALLSTTTVFAWACPAFALEPSAIALTDEISCSSNFGNAVELDKTSFHLVPVTGEEVAILQKSEPALSAGPLSGGQFAYERLGIYLAVAKDDDRNSMEATLSIYARAVRAPKDSPNESWFKITQAGDRVTAPDFFDFTLGDTGEGSGQGADENSSPGVSFAVQGTNIPLFKVTWLRQETGANTFAGV